jgi:hypothetical protein
LADCRSQLVFQNLAEAVAIFRPAAAKLRQEVPGDPNGEAAIRSQRQIDGLQRKPDPSIFEAYPAASRSLDQVRAKQAPNVGEHGGVTGRVKPVASVVHPLLRNLETPSVPAHGLVLLCNGYAGCVIEAQAVRGSDAGRTGSEDDDVRLGPRHVLMS